MYVIHHESEEQRDCRYLVELITRHGGRITPNELRRASRVFRNSTSDATAALQELVESGYGQWQEVQPGPKGGRPTRQFVLSRQLNPLSAAEDGGIGSVDKVDSFQSDFEEVVK